MKQLPPTKETLDAMRLQGKSRAEMCEATGVSISLMKRLIKALGVSPRPTKNSAQKKPSGREKPRYLAVDEGISLMDRCKQILGPRMGEDHRGYLLDGRPASSTQVIKASGLQARPGG